MLSCQRHKQSVVLQPVRLLPAKGLQPFVPGSQQPGAGAAEHRVAGAVHQSIVHRGRIISPIQRLVLLRLQQPFRRQIIQVNEVGIPRIGGKRLVGGITKPRGPNRKDLPAALAPVGQKFDKLPRFLSHGPDAVSGGQGGDGHQNSSFSQLNLTSPYPLASLSRLFMPLSYPLPPKYARQVRAHPSDGSFFSIRPSRFPLSAPVRRAIMEAAGNAPRPPLAPAAAPRKEGFVCLTMLSPLAGSLAAAAG